MNGRAHDLRRDVGNYILVDRKLTESKYCRENKGCCLANAPTVLLMR